MIPRKLIEIGIRRIPLLLLLVLVPPGVLWLLHDSDTQYQSVARIWITSADAGGGFGSASNPYLTTAQNQAQIFRDLMQTASFREEVAVEAGIIPEDASRALVEKGTDWVARTVSFGAVGSNVVGVAAIAPSPQEARALVTAFIDTYVARADESLSVQLTRQQESLTNQLAAAEHELEKRNAELSQYLADHPQAGSQDPSLIRLVTRSQEQTTTVDEYRDNLSSVTYALENGTASVLSSFAVEDPPSLPSDPVPQSLTQDLGYPIAAAILGLALAAGILYAQYRTDHSIQSREDLVAATVPFLGYVPEVTPGPISRLRTRDYARRIAATLPLIPEGRSG